MVAFFNGAAPTPREQDIDYSVLTKDEQGIAWLAKHGSWKQVIIFCDQALKNALPDVALRIKTQYITALVRLRRFQQATAELNKLCPLDSADKLYQSHPTVYGKDKSGSMVPFALEVVQAELPFLMDGEASLEKSQRHMLRLRCRVLSKISLVREGRASEDGALGNVVTEDELIERWYSVSLKLVGYLSDQKSPDFSLAHKITMELITHARDSAATAQSSSFGLGVLYSGMGRMFLQFGDVSNAKASFDAAVPYLLYNQTEPLTNRALIMLADGRWQEAFQLLNDHVIQDNSVSPVIVNNYAVCAIHVNKLDLAISSLENLIQRDPVNNLTETAVWNLRILYDLASTNPAQQKKTLNSLVRLYAKDDVFASVGVVHVRS